MTAFLAVVVSGASVLIVSVFSWWQWRIAREKLRHDLYDRRFAIYMAFHELLVAFTEKDDVDAELRRANAARAHSPFLLNAKLENYLRELHAEAFQLNGMNELALRGSLGRAETADLALKLGPQKLDFANRIPELVREFEPFLKLRDFSRSR